MPCYKAQFLNMDCIFSPCSVHGCFDSFTALKQLDDQILHWNLTLHNAGALICLIKNKFVTQCHQQNNHDEMHAAA